MKKGLCGLAVVALVVAATAAAAFGRPAQTAAPAAIPGCAPSALHLRTSGTLTIGTDNPAYPPWWGGAQKKPWKISNPYSGKGYESAVSYAIAQQLGFKRGKVAWTYVPFSQSYRPGKKKFDFYLAQVSYTKDRAKVVDFSNAYYFVNQALVARKGTAIAKAKSIRALRSYKLGAQLGTTSYQYIVDFIKPMTKPLVYSSNDLAVQALKSGQIDGIVVDLPTAFYVTAVQVPDGTIVGQFPNRGGREHFGLVFEKGNPLRTCVNKALNRLWANGTIKSLQHVWLAKVAGAPELK